MRTIDALAGGLLVLAGLNCGLIAVFQYDLVGAVLGAGPGPAALSRLFLGLVGVAAVYRLAAILHPTPVAVH